MKAVLVYHNAEIVTVVLTDDVAGVKEIAEKTQDEYVKEDCFFCELLEENLEKSDLQYTLVEPVEAFEG